MITTNWQPLLAPPLRQRVLDVVSAVAARFTDPEQTLAIAREAIHQSAAPLQPAPEALTFGPGGPALACAYLDRCFPDQSWDLLAHHYLDTQRVPGVFNYPYLHGGCSGLGFILTLLSRNGTRYQRSIQSINQNLCRFAETIQPGRPSILREGDYDAIAGASGLLAYFLALRSREPAITRAIERLLTYLIWLTGRDESTQRARWYIAPEALMTEEKLQLHPAGYYNCGLAHGIAGPLAALALAWLEGYRIPGQREALTSVSNWLLDHSVTDAWGINWPDVVPLPASFTARHWKQLPPARAGWCYGAPGIARALWLTGAALESASLRQTAIEALEAVLRRPIAERRIASPTLCHGIAGLLTICLHFAQEETSTTLAAHIPTLVTQILDLFNPDLPLGFRDQERDQVFVDQPAWLNGVPGILMALLAAATPTEPLWSRALLLA
jgi:lantibiotic modifying enzyme